MKKKKLKLNKDTLLVLESGRLNTVAGGLVAVPKGTAACSTLCTHFGCPTGNCDTSGCSLGCPETANCETSHCPNATDNCSVGCPTTPQPLP